MQACGYDEIRIDPMGNILGRIGNGPRVLALDAHVDTVDVGNRGQLVASIPSRATSATASIYGRGACDMKGALASIVYGGRIVKELGLEGDVHALGRRAACRKRTATASAGSTSSTKTA